MGTTAETLERATDDAPEPERDDETAEETARFDDPYWDDAFCAWWDPALRTCCG